MPHVLHTIWLDSHEPTNKDTLWIKPLKKDYYGIFVYGSNGWTLTTALFKGTIGEFVVDQLPEATTESNGVMSAQDKTDLEMLKASWADIDIIIEAINNMDQTPTEGSQNVVSSGGVYESLEGKVDVVDGKGLSTEDFTSEEKNKLASIPDDVVNGIQSDWNTNNTGSVSYVKNRTHWTEDNIIQGATLSFIGESLSDVDFYITNTNYHATPTTESDSDMRWALTAEDKELRIVANKISSSDVGVSWDLSVYDGLNRIAVCEGIASGAEKTINTTDAINLGDLYIGEFVHRLNKKFMPSNMVYFGETYTA